MIWKRKTSDYALVCTGEWSDLFVRLLDLTFTYKIIKYTYKKKSHSLDLYQSSGHYIPLHKQQHFPFSTSLEIFSLSFTIWTFANIKLRPATANQLLTFPHP